jgi:hypothetical protein
MTSFLAELLMRPAYDASTAVEIARTDDLVIDVTLDATDGDTGQTAPLTTGAVSHHLSLWPPSLTPLPSSVAVLAHQGAGRWVGARDVTEIAAALASRRDGTRLALVLVVNGAMARYRPAVVVTMRRSEAG